MKKIYLDNAATSWPKPGEMVKAMKYFFEEIGCSPGRGGYECSLKAGRIVLEARLKLSEFFNIPAAEQVIFTQNVTHSLNFAIKGLLAEGDHVITTCMEHNAVIRPLRRLENEGIIEISFLPCNEEGLLSCDNIEQYIKSNTKMLIVTHASNVTGSLMPVERLGNIAKKNSIIFVLDAAQTAGVYSIDFQKLNLDLLAFTGHKGLLGPPGTGGFAISKRAAKEMKTLIEGGTGSISDSEYQPDFLPDKFESGTLNVAGIAGLKASVDFIMNEGLQTIREHELNLLEILYQGLKNIRGINVYGPKSLNLRTPTISITAEGCDVGEMSYNLDREHGIMVRSGLHCAPLAHKTIGTFPEGTLRFSIGCFNTEEEVHYVLKCLQKMKI